MALCGAAHTSVAGRISLISKMVCPPTTCRFGPDGAASTGEADRVSTLTRSTGTLCTRAADESVVGPAHAFGPACAAWATPVVVAVFTNIGSADAGLLFDARAARGAVGILRAEYGIAGKLRTAFFTAISAWPAAGVFTALADARRRIAGPTGAASLQTVAQNSVVAIGIKHACSLALGVEFIAFVRQAANVEFATAFVIEYSSSLAGKFALAVRFTGLTSVAAKTVAATAVAAGRHGSINADAATQKVARVNVTEIRGAIIAVVALDVERTAAEGDSALAGRITPKLTRPGHVIVVRIDVHRRFDGVLSRIRLAVRYLRNTTTGDYTLGWCAEQLLSAAQDKTVGRAKVARRRHGRSRAIVAWGARGRV